MKLAKVLPIYKSENEQLVQNYRPISVLPYFSKIYERVIYNHIIDYIDDNNTLYEKQFGFRKGHSTSLHLLQKKAVRIIDNSHYIAHTEPICKVHRILKVSDMFSIALWKFYHKLMNNKLPKCFSTIKPNLPVITEHYEIRNPVFHLPAIKHKFAESSLQYCLIKLINEQNCFNEMTDKVQRTSIYSFKVFLKQRVLDTYKSTCKIDKCKTCAIINM